MGASSLLLYNKSRSFWRLSTNHNNLSLKGKKNQLQLGGKFVVTSCHDAGEAFPY